MPDVSSVVPAPRFAATMGHYLINIQTRFKLAWERRGFLHMKDRPWKMQMGPRRAVAGGSTSRSNGSTGKPLHAIPSSSSPQVLRLFVTSSCPRRPHPQLSNLSISYFFIIFGLFLLTFSELIFFIPAGWPNFFPASLKDMEPKGKYFVKNHPAKILHRAPSLRIRNAPMWDWLSNPLHIQSNLFPILICLFLMPKEIPLRKPI